jgi:hypothetical protein
MFIFTLGAEFRREKYLGAEFRREKYSIALVYRKLSENVF